MTAYQKLILVKTIHTAVWVFFNLVLIFLFYSVLTNHISIWFWIGIGCFAIECAVLTMNGWVCPLTPIARKYTISTKDNFDIYLPEWVAKHNKTIYTILLIILAILYFSIVD